MKLLKTKILPLFLFVTAALSLMMTSCTKDGTDLRDQVVGQYSYTVKIYTLVGTDLVYVGNQGTNYDITGTMRVSKNSGDPAALDFYDGNMLMFQGIDVKDVGNAIVFDIPSQEAWVGPGNVQVAGYLYWKVNTTNYHGAYLYADKSVEIAFSAKIMDVDTGLVMILTAVPK